MTYHAVFRRALVACSLLVACCLLVAGQAAAADKMMMMMDQPTKLEPIEVGQPAKLHRRHPPGLAGLGT